MFEKNISRSAYKKAELTNIQLNIDMFSQSPDLILNSSFHYERYIYEHIYYRYRIGWQTVLATTGTILHGVSQLKSDYAK